MRTIITIKEYVTTLLTTNKPSAVATMLGVSTAMVSTYKLHEYNPSLDVACKVFATDGTVLHPYAADSLLFEINKANNEVG